MLGIGSTELVIILIFGFLIFGPDRLPAMGRTIGRALRQFKSAQDQMNKMVKTEITDPINEAIKEPVKKQGPKKKVSGTTSSTKPETFAEKKARLAAEAEAAAKRNSATPESAGSGDTVEVPVKPVGTSETFKQKKARLDAEKAAAAAQKAAGITTPAKPKTTTAKKTGSAAKLYGVDKDKIAALRAAAQNKDGKEEQADA